MRDLKTFAFEFGEANKIEHASIESRRQQARYRYEVSFVENKKLHCNNQSNVHSEE